MPKEVRRPAPWGQVSEDLNQIQGICLDIDDTLSTHGKLTAEAFTALWNLHEAGYALVPITGRPAGWCDHIARFWPVDAVVGENGAFTFFMEDGIRKRINTPAGMDLNLLQLKLKSLEAEIQKRFPHVQWASDQLYREFDLAVDFCEDVKPWPSNEVNELVKLCHTQGAQAKISSIHVNTWFGQYDKRKGFEYWLSQGSPGLLRNKGSLQHEGSPDAWKKKWIFIGDSPNDEPLFEAFQYSVGVANLKKFLPQLKFPPTWITREPSGKGFQEMSEILVSLKAKKKF